MSGKRPLNRRNALKLGHALGLSSDEIETFLKTLPKKTGSNVVKIYDRLDLDLFRAVSEWHHDALLELTHLKCFQPDPTWIAKALGIKKKEVQLAVERLQRLGLLSISDDGTWLDISRSNTTNISNDVSDVALRNLQAKILQLSQRALEQLPRTKRDHTSMTVAVNVSDLPEVKERIRRFRLELTEFIERTGVEADAVYQLAVSFFPLTTDAVSRGDDET